MRGHFSEARRWLGRPDRATGWRDSHAAPEGAANLALFQDENRQSIELWTERWSKPRAPRHRLGAPIKFARKALVLRAGRRDGSRLPRLRREASLIARQRGDSGSIGHALHGSQWW